MNQTFHSGQKQNPSGVRGGGNVAQGKNQGAFQRPASLDNQPVPSRQQQYTADIHNGTMNLDDTLASNGFS